MTRRLSPEARLALLGDVMRLLRQRRRSVHSVILHPDGTIEVRLGQPDGEPTGAEQPGSWAEYDAESE